MGCRCRQYTVAAVVAAAAPDPRVLFHRFSAFQYILSHPFLDFSFFLLSHLEWQISDLGNRCSSFSVIFGECWESFPPFFVFFSFLCAYLPLPLSRFCFGARREGKSLTVLSNYPHCLGLPLLRVRSSAEAGCASLMSLIEKGEGKARRAREVQLRLPVRLSGRELVTAFAARAQGAFAASCLVVARRGEES
ncbi:hypothetical protein JOL62DRAFT_66076 [Phyllosticta paracitricarpa]|uniref:Transmembrane protein n=1 Tax=Phyllosticta paracitricarpa TaxID=2016321 RepID=A0ABR1N8Z0_9PEZI